MKPVGDRFACSSYMTGSVLFLIEFSKLNFNSTKLMLILTNHFFYLDS